MSAPFDHPTAVFAARRFGLVQPRGDVCGESAIRAGWALVGHPAWEPGFAEVWDFRTAGSVVVRPPAVVRLRAFEAEVCALMRGSVTVFLTGRRPLLEHAAGFYDRLVRPLGRRVVACRTEADVADLIGGVVPTLGRPAAA